MAAFPPPATTSLAGSFSGHLEVSPATLPPGNATSWRGDLCDEGLIGILIPRNVPDPNVDADRCQESAANSRKIRPLGLFLGDIMQGYLTVDLSGAIVMDVIEAAYQKYCEERFCFLRNKRSWTLSGRSVLPFPTITVVFWPRITAGRSTSLASRRRPRTVCGTG